jgi:hypothetical protein
MNSVSQQQLEARLIDDFDIIFGYWVMECEHRVRLPKEVIKHMYARYSVDFFRRAIETLSGYEEYEMCDAFRELIAGRVRV